MKKVLDRDEAWEVTTKTCAYTNHTIMAEDVREMANRLILQNYLPRVYQIVEEIDRRFVNKIREMYPGNEEKVKKMAILWDGQVRMAHMAYRSRIFCQWCCKTSYRNLKESGIKRFLSDDAREIQQQDKWNHTRDVFLMHGNPLLADWVTKKLGTDTWATDLSLMSGLKKYVDDPKAQKEFMDIKLQNKKRLAKYILEHNGVEVDPTSIFDVQVKRLHEYKRQLMNILHVMYLYNQLKKNPNMKFYPRTFILVLRQQLDTFVRKQTIKLINSVADKRK